MIILKGATAHFYKSGMRGCGSLDATIRIDEGEPRLCFDPAQVPAEAEKVQFRFSLAIDGQETLAEMHSSVVELVK